MIKSRAQKSFMNIGVMSIYQVVVLICGLITPRYILAAFGSSYNGITASIVQFLSFITILRAGVAGSSRVALYKTLAKNDGFATSRILKSTEVYLRKIALGFLLYLIILAIFYKTISGTIIPWIECASLVIIIGFGTFAQYYFGLAYQTLLAADQKNYIYYIQQIIVTILNTLVAVILIRSGASIQIVKFGSAIIFVANPILLNLYVSKRYKIIKDCEPDNSALRQKKDVMGLAIANIVHENTDIAILTVFMDIKVVSVYSVYNLVIGGLKKVLSVFTTGLEAAFGNMLANNETGLIRRNFGIFELIIYSFVSVVFSCTIVLILPFVSIYTKGITDINYIHPLYAIVAVIAQAFFCMRIPYMTLVQAAGHYKETRNGSFIEAGLNLTLSLVFVKLYGILGVAIGTLAADIFRTLQYAKYCCDHLVELAYISVIKRFIWTLFNVFTTVYFYSLFKVSAIESWDKWVFTAVTIFIFSVIITFISALVFYKDDLFAANGIVKRTFNKKYL